MCDAAMSTESKLRQWVNIPLKVSHSLFPTRHRNAFKKHIMPAVRFKGNL